MPTVVIADDSPVLRRIVSSVLEREGFTIVAAEDGVQAVQAVFATMPDAVVLDVQMPRVSGYVAARVLKDDWRTMDIPILFLTSLDAASDRYWAAQAGAENFLTKDFEAPQLVEAVTSAMAGADAERGGRPPLRSEPIEMTDDDVFGSVSDILDRKLFESSIASDVMAIAADAHGFEETIAQVLSVLARVVDYDLAAVLMTDDRSTYIRVATETSQQQYAQFFEAVADAAADATGTDVAVSDLQARVADPESLLGADDEGELATFVSMPLKVSGRMVGVLALSSARANAFGETSLNTLRLVSGPAGVVVAQARYAGVTTF
jgi:twitching motility two-component system response regulator PilH